ncbi:MFS transporter [Streptomyces antarcticus]|uniref:MFS transporter n=1 Tax=Streptomyces antarcticus TaxID=2996458 RepID=UPI00226E65DE|nr:MULTISPECIES: MFS transporter [unclassified Streptomyces]MCY0942927.1 MFS transporter [Streptomyces sp. H34-AA3]MCZ4083113.1 MFS transporter [Streptomyces sp. H34-S5]
MTNAAQAPAGKAGRREWIGLGILALPTLLIALDIGVLFLALPQLSGDLGTSGTEQLWITDIYGFMLAGFLITMGNLGDRIGRRKLLLIGAAAFGAASILAAYANSPEMLIAARALLGIAGATLNPSTLALISNMFRDDKQRGVAISLWATCQFGGAALGPLVGGLMLDHFWWGSVFLLGVPVMVVLLVAGPRLLPEYRTSDSGRRLDLVSVVMSLLAILPTIYGIKELAAGGAQSSEGVAWAALAIGLAFAVAFVRRQGTLKDPLVDLQLFSEPAFAITLGAMALASGAFAGTSFLTSQYIMSVADLTPTAAGLWQAPTGGGIAAGVLLAPLFLRWMTPRTAMVGGLTLSALAYLVLTQVGAEGGLVTVVVCIALVAFGVGPLFALGTGLVIGSAPVEKAGAAASLSESSNVLGSTLGLAVLGTLSAAVYRDEVSGAVPDTLASPAAKAAQETVAGGTASAAELGGDAGQALLSAAREAFTSGLNTVSWVAATVAVAVGVAVAVVLREKTVQQDGPQPTDAGSLEEARA